MAQTAIPELVIRQIVFFCGFLVAYHLRCFLLSHQRGAVLYIYSNTFIRQMTAIKEC